MNQVINLNGLTFDISLKLEFIADKELDAAPDRRRDFQTTQNDAKQKFIEEQEKRLKDARN